MTYGASGLLTATRMPGTPARGREIQVAENPRHQAQGQIPARPGSIKPARRTYLLGSRGEVVTQRPSLPGQIRRSLIVALPERHPSLVQKVLRRRQCVELRRAHLTAFEIAEKPLDLADPLPRRVEKLLLLFRGQLGSQRSGRLRSGAGARDRDGRPRGGLEHGLEVAAPEQSDDAARHEDARSQGGAAGRVRTIVVPRPISDSISIRPSWSCTIR